METTFGPTVQSEKRRSERNGVRWAVLANWYADLCQRVGRVDPGIAAMIFAARGKVASGVCSAHDLGGDLARIEEALVSFTASKQPELADAWLERLAEAVAHPEAATSRPGFRPIPAASLPR